MNPESEKLYNLLPALYRIRDAEQGFPLKALCGVLAEEIALLRENLDQLYDDQFIETCGDWVAPYIGDLIGYRPIHGVTARTVSARAEVANTIAYRRRKGTATVLEQLARDVTGWNARVVEFFQQLATSQYMNHVRLENRVTADLRDGRALERRGTAFNTLAHSVDVRHIEPQKGRYNIPNIGLFLWRLDAFSLTQSPAFSVDAQRFMFSPLGNDVRLFNRPQTEPDITHLADPINVPEPISRRVLDRDLDRLRWPASKESSDYYDEQKSVFVSADNNIDTSADNVHVCDLSDDGASWAHLPKSNEKIAIDPVLGRIAFPAGTVPQNVRVNFYYGFSMAMGGGEYERRKSFLLTGSATVVTQGLQSALASAKAGGIVEIGDSGRYEETVSIAVEVGAKLELRAANEHRPALILSGDLNVELKPGAELTLNGLLIAGGQLRIAAVGNTEERPPVLRLRHCTLVPGLALTRTGDPKSPDQASLIIDTANATVEIDHCIVGAVRCGRGVTVKITNSIVDAITDQGVAFSDPDELSAGGILTVINSTVIGKVHSARLELASNAIFIARLGAGDPWPHAIVTDQNQQGCVRFSFVPLNAIVPRRYRCQPDLAVAVAISAADVPRGSLSPAKKQAIALATQTRVRPAFTTLRYGQPGYCQLGNYCPKEIRTGAEDESEMGAFHDVFAAQRESNLKIRLQEYLRFGLEAGIFYST
jgi:hypothetical protein